MAKDESFLKWKLELLKRLKVVKTAYFRVRSQMSNM